MLETFPPSAFTSAWALRHGMERDATRGCRRKGTQQTGEDRGSRQGYQQSREREAGCRGRAAGGCKRGERPREGGKHDT